MTPVDPLFDTLFRPTTLPPEIASAAPARTAGTRSRAGNAMNRTRSALLDGARRAVEVSGTKITMSQVAAAAGVAKATLYNHFRTREAVLSALLVAEVNALVEAQSGRELADSLSDAANAISRHPVLRALARVEPGTLAAIGCIDGSATGWRIAADAVGAALATESRAGGETVLRWLGSYVISPGGPASIAADLAIVLAGLPDAVVPQAPSAAAPEEVAAAVPQAPPAAVAQPVSAPVPQTPPAAVPQAASAAVAQATPAPETRSVADAMSAPEPVHQARTA